MPYRRTRHLLSKGERAFWFPLYYAVRGKYRVFCKVRLGDIVDVSDRHSQSEWWFRRIGGFHIDFVICDPKTTAPLLAIELDDRTHRTPKQVKRDQFKEAVLRAADVPLYRVTAQEAYDPAALAKTIDRMISTIRPAASDPG